MLKRHLTVAVVVLLLASCADDSEDSSTSSTPSTAPAATSSPTSAPAASTTTISTVSTAATTAATVSTTTTTASVVPPAIWPAAGVVFTTPEQAAEDFVRNVLGVPPVLSEFRQGDARSGEIDVLSPGEGDSANSVRRGTLLLQRLGPDHGWFVLAAVNDNAAIASPATAGEAPASPLTVTGRGRGFEANIVVTAFVAGDADRVLDQQITMGGSAETPEPFTVTLDLTAASPGDTVVLLVRGGTGLETDPGEFGAIPVTIVA